MAMARDWLVRHVRNDHERLLERLRSLDHCLDNIFYHGEVCSDLRGFGGLRVRCRELQQTLRKHIPEEEKMFERVTGKSEAGQWVERLVLEHRALTASLDACLETLDALQEGELLPEDLFALQDRVRALSADLRQHITTENQLILPLLGPA
ncbi:MAG: hemerythrin domain-containing protein [Terriglobia bacterium]